MAYYAETQQVALTKSSLLMMNDIYMSSSRVFFMLSAVSSGISSFVVAFQSTATFLDVFIGNSPVAGCQHLNVGKCAGFVEKNK